MKFKKYLFDFDGTIGDSMPTWIKKVKMILDGERIACTDEILRKITPLGDVGTAKYFKTILGVKSSIEEMLAKMNSIAEPAYKDRISLKPGVADYLKRLKQNDCSLSILSASPLNLLLPCLERNGIIGYFDNVWCSESFNISKSEPLIYMEVASKLNSNLSEVIFFDDNINAVRASVDAGIYTVGVYDKSADSVKMEIKEIANEYLDSFLNLPSYLLPTE